MIDSKTFEKAIIFAAKCHEGQVRKGDGRPYILHPISVMTRIMAIKKSANLYLLGTAAVLHDVVEDCLEGMTDEDKLKMIAAMFGYHVAGLVQELTLDKSKYESIGKKEYLAEELIKMSSYALAIKLCDRLDNICDMKSMSRDFVERYIVETKYILEEVKKGRELSKTHKKLIVLLEKEMRKYLHAPTAGTRRRYPDGKGRPLGGGTVLT